MAENANTNSFLHRASQQKPNRVPMEGSSLSNFTSPQQNMQVDQSFYAL